MNTKLSTRVSLFLALLAAVTAGMVAFLATGSARAATTANVQSAESQNWAGYVASGKTFSSVSGSWTVPTVSADPNSDQSYSAVWVGLGGSDSTSSSLEQIGTGSDDVNGQTDYYAWYELLPAGQVRLNLAIHPGDRISAHVSVSGTSVTLALNDTTTGQSINRTLQMNSPDVSSAEWIVEAPATQSFGGTEILPLADFSKITFTSATATASGHTGGVSDPNWSATQVQLSAQGGSDSGGPGFIVGGSDAAYAQSGAEASTSTLTGDSFSVSWEVGSDQSTSSTQPEVSQYPGAGDPYSYGGGGSAYPYSYGDGGSGYPYSYGDGGSGYPYSYGDGGSAYPYSYGGGYGQALGYPGT